jgi:alkylation response protein AidB-like acyl-CoA dehydrogenase
MIMLHDSEDEEALRSTFRQLFTKYQDNNASRSAQQSDRPPLWSGLAETGALDMAAPDSDGSDGATLAQLCVLAEEAGRNLDSVGLVEHLVATRFLGESGIQRHDDALRNGAVATVAVRPSRDGLWETVPVVPDATLAIGVHGDHTVAVQLAGTRCRRLGPLRVCDVAVHEAPSTHLGAAAGFSRAVDTWRILTAAFLVGMCEAALARTVDYVGTRNQFGRVVGAYQAVQHGLAELPGLIDGARLLLAKAAWALNGHGEAASIDLARNDITDGRVLASMAVLFAAETATAVVDRAVHYHGAIGAASETGLYDCYRVARSLPLLLGPVSAERRHLADLLLVPTWTSH